MRKQKRIEKKNPHLYVAAEDMVVTARNTIAMLRGEDAKEYKDRPLQEYGVVARPLPHQVKRLGKDPKCPLVNQLRARKRWKRSPTEDDLHIKPDFLVDFFDTLYFMHSLSVVRRGEEINSTSP